MAIELNHPQVTDDMIEIWLRSPVTIAYLKCLEFKRKDTRDAAGTGLLIDSSSADTTHALLHRALGQQDAYREASLPKEFLAFYNMIFIPEPEDDE